jgi:hypothetical protein
MKQLARVASLAVAACLLLAAASASSASASWVPAKVSGGPTVKVTTSGATAKRAGGEAKSCSILSGAANGSVISENHVISFWNVSLWYGKFTRFECGGTSILDLSSENAVAEYETVSGNYRLSFWPETFETIINPWGTHYTGSSFTVPFTNGSGGTPSTFTMTESVIGHEGGTGKAITLSGTFKITNGTGGLLTLTH